MRRVGDLEVDQDLVFERRVWVFQRVGWAVMTAAVLAALLGLLGPGPASSARAGTPDGTLASEYSRFVRASAETRLSVSFGRGAVQGEEVRLWIDRRYLEQASIERVTPEPASVEVGGDRLVYVFSAAAGESGQVTFSLTPRAFGRWRARIGVEGGPTLAFGQFVFP